MNVRGDAHRQTWQKKISLKFTNRSSSKKVQSFRRNIFFGWKNQIMLEFHQYQKT